MSLVQTSFPDAAHPVAVYTLTLTNPPDHRLTSALLGDLGKALDQVERDWWQRREAFKEAQAKLDKSQRTKGPGTVGGAIIIRGEGEKFFSNGSATAAYPGLAYEDSLKDPTFHPFVHRFSLVYNPVILRLLSFPLLTVAAINGHCFAGGFLLSLACDFRLMREELEGRRAWCCMNEIDFGAPLPPLFAAVLRDRLPRALLQQTLLGERLTSTALASHGVVTLSPPSDAGLMQSAHQLAAKIGAKAATGVWGEIRSEIWRDIVVVGDKDGRRMPNMPWDVERHAKERLNLPAGLVQKAKL